MHAYTCMSVCSTKRGSKPVIYLHDTSLVHCSVVSVIMISLVFTQLFKDRVGL